MIDWGSVDAHNSTKKKTDLNAKIKTKYFIFDLI